MKLDDEYVVSEYAWRNGGGPAGGTAMFLPLKSSTRIEDLLRGLLVQSGNDAALVLAEGSAGSEETFVLRMNKRANEIRGNEKDLRFWQPLGKISRRSETRHTRRDDSKLCRLCYQERTDYLSLLQARERIYFGIKSVSRTAIPC